MVVDVRTPSCTAYGAAIHRALHQELDGGNVFRDPLVWQMVGMPPSHPALVAIARDRGLRHFLAARHAFGESSLEWAVRRGVSQAVILGTGLDTFAYRNPHDNLHVYEADLPSMVAWKQRHVRRQGIAVPREVTYVGVDLEGDLLSEPLCLRLRRRSTGILPLPGIGSLPHA